MNSIAKRMFLRGGTRAAGAIAVLGATTIGCGASATPTGDWGPEADDAAAVFDVRGATPGAEAQVQASDAASDADADASGGDEDASAVDGCASEVVRAMPAPLDVFFLLDTSGSMADLAAPGVSKWRALTSAMETFVNDPASAGMSVAFQSFPLLRTEAPSTCTTNDDCGPAGPCDLLVCDSDLGTTCQTDADCVGSCIPAGECSADPNYFCSLSGAGLSCGTDANGFDLGTCESIAAPACDNADSCVPADYGRAALPFATLPAAAADAAGWLLARQPGGSTPTSSALAGAIGAAQEQATLHPDHAVVVVLATDGAPDESAAPSGDGCVFVDTAGATTGTAAIAAAGLAATPSIRTFAIGVFTPVDAAAGTAGVAAVADAGGTGRPYVVGADLGALGDGGASVESEFEAALQSIRGSSIPCRYTVPAPASAGLGLVDATALSVTYASGGGAPTPLPQVASAGACGAGQGWFSDTGSGNAGGGQTIDLCPAACTTVAADPGARVDVVFGCPAVVR